MAKYRRRMGSALSVGTLICGVLPVLVGCASTSAKSNVDHITIAEYKAEPEHIENTVYIFSADWCKPCQLAKPVVEKEAIAKGDRVVIVDVNDFRIFDKLGYKSLPLFRLTKLTPPKDELYKGWSEDAFLKFYRAF